MARGEERQQQQGIAEGPLVLLVQQVEEVEEAPGGEGLQQLDPAPAMAGHVPQRQPELGAIEAEQRRRFQGGGEEGRRQGSEKARPPGVAHGDGARMASTSSRSSPVLRMPCITPSGAMSIVPACIGSSRPSSRKTPRPASTW